jgi:2-polyprenyl-3-methyl-5-hydroxy-6-metoxy-1,4-benzoquinol methylase
MLGVTQTILRRVHHKIFEAPKGYGESLPPEYFDNQYFSGTLDFLGSVEEFANHMVTAGYLRHYTADAGAEGRILDVGCGEGIFAELATKLTPAKYTGLDISREAVRRAGLRDIPNADFVSGDAMEFETSERFDVIMSAGAIHHFTDAVALLEHLSQFLKPGGVFVISLWRYGYNGMIWQRLEKAFDLVDSTVVRNHKGQEWDVKVLAVR